MNTCTQLFYITISGFATFRACQQGSLHCWHWTHLITAPLICHASLPSVLSLSFQSQRTISRYLYQYCAGGMRNGFTVAMLYLQACTTCETAGSPNCSTSGQDGAGVPDADFVVYVAARSSNCRGSTLAYAAHCFQDKTTDRYTHATYLCVYVFCMSRQYMHANT